MKKLTILSLILLCAAVLLTACAAEQPGTTDDTVPSAAIDPTAAPTVPTAAPTDPPTDSTDPTELTIPLATIPGEPLEYQPGLIQLIDRKSDDYSFERRYRAAYYTIWGEFQGLLDDEQEEDFDIWFNQYIKETNYGEFQTEMLLVTMVKRYNIPRDEFDKAVEQFVTDNAVLGWGMMCEEYEVPNADVIYTFDNELINRYYRYE